MAQTSYTWTGAAGTAWNSPANWSPATGFPLAADNATIVAALNAPVLDMARAVTNLSVSSGMLDLGGFTLTSSGTGTYAGGTVKNGTLAINSSGIINFTGSLFGASVVATCPDPRLNGATFNAPLKVTKTGTGTSISSGGCTFNATTELINSGTGVWRLDYTAADAFNGDLVVNSTSTGDLQFGQNGGSATLAAGRTISVGTLGFNAGILALRNFTQVGSTPQNLALGSGAAQYFQQGSTFNGPLTATAGRMFLNGATFNATGQFTKNGPGNDYSTGGNTFNAPTEFINAGTGLLSLNNTGSDNFNGNILVNNTSGGQIWFGQSGGNATLASGATISVGSLGFASGNLVLRSFTQLGGTAQNLTVGSGASLFLYPGSIFNGPVTANAGNITLSGASFNSPVTAMAGSMYISGSTFNATGKFTKTGPSGDASTGGNTFNGTTEFINTSTGNFSLDYTGSDAFNGDIWVSSTSTGTIWFGQNGGNATLAAGRTISVGTLGYNTGTLGLRNFMQAGGTPQNILLGTSAGLYIYPGSSFNGPLTAAAGSMFLNGATFNATGQFTKTGPSGDGSTGGNTFNATAEFINTSSGNFSLDYTGSDAFNGDILVSNTSTGTIQFGQNGGNATLAAGRTISVGTLGFNTGTFTLRNFTQVGGTPQNILLGTPATLNFQLGSAFNGPVTAVAGSMYIIGTTFNATGKFTKTGPSGDGSLGGNIFNATAEFINTGSGNFSLDYTGSDAFNGDILVSNTSTGTIWFGQNGGNATLAVGRTISVGALGFNAGILALRNFTQVGGTPQNLVLGSGAAQYVQQGSTFNGPLTATAGSMFLNGATFNATGKFTKTGPSGDASLGGNTFNATAEFINTNSGNFSLDYTGADAFNGDILVSNTSSGTIQFGQNGGNATLAAGRTISVGVLGYNTGTLAMRNFTQVGGTPQNIVLGTSASLNFNPGSTFNGPLTAAAGTLYISGSTFNSTGKFTKTGPSGDGSAGGNTFNATAEFVNTSTGNFSLDYTGSDAFNGNILVSSTSTGTIRFGQNGGNATMAAGKTISVGSLGFNTGTLILRNFTQLGGVPQNILLGTNAILYIYNGSTFNGPVTTTSGSLFLWGTTYNAPSRFTKTGPSTDASPGGNTFNATAEFVNTNVGNLGLDNSGTDMFNGDILVNNTSTGAIQFGQSGGGAILAAGRTISVGSLGYNAGLLILGNFTQLGGTPQSLLLGAPAGLYFQQASTFNGPLTCAAGRMFLNGATFNGASKFTKTGPNADGSLGGNTFNATAEFINTGSGNFSLDYIGADAFNGDILVNSISSGTIQFGQNGGNATLAVGRTIGVGALGYNTGTLTLRNFTQLGGAVQNLSLGTAASLYYNPGTTFNGPITSTSGTLYLNTTTFNATARLEKTGSASNASFGGNQFNGDLELRSYSGPISLGNNAADLFAGNASFIRTGSGALQACCGFNTSFQGHVSTAGSTGTVTFGAGSGCVVFNGSGVQQFTSDAAYPPDIRNLRMDKPAGTLNLLGSVNVTNTIAFAQGVIRPQAATSTGNGLLVLASGSSITTPANAGSYVDGFVRKVGNQAFTFPVGNAGLLAPVAISAPSNAAHHFTAKYVHQDPDSLYDDAAKDASIDHISNCEYWIVDRTNGTSNVTVSLSWDSPRSCGVTDLAQLVVARWNGTQWKDQGNGGWTGTVTSGTLVSSGAVTSFSPFTLASRNGSNPLPVELLSFTAEANGPVNDLHWATASEHFNSHFTVERSADGQVFHSILQQPGAGNSQQVIQYAATDVQPLQGLNYYRLVQVDLDGTRTISSTVVVANDRVADNGLVLYPNPSPGELNVAVQRTAEEVLQVQLWDVQGRCVLTAPLAADVRGIDASALPAGTYRVTVLRNGEPMGGKTWVKY